MSRNLLFVFVVLASGCTKDMAIQKRLKPQNHVMAEAPAGTIEATAAVQDQPADLGRLLARGEERYGIHCALCHGRAGLGNGIIVQRGFKNPRALDETEVRARSDQNLFDIISDGYESMAGYRRMITTDDRRAIVAFVRLLQLRRHVPARILEPQDLQALGEKP